MFFTSNIALSNHVINKSQLFEPAFLPGPGLAEDLQYKMLSDNLELLRHIKEEVDFILQFS